MNVQEKTQLVRYDAMCRAIDAAFKTDEVKAIRGEAIALAAYAKQASNYEAERKAAMIRIRAERRLGELIKAQKETVGLNKGGGGRSSTGSRIEPVDAKPTLADAGIDKKLSMNAQRLADIPQDKFETILASEPRPTTDGVISAAFPVTMRNDAKPASPRALWLWGRLKDFERQGLLDVKPSDVFGEMPEQWMRDEVSHLAILISKWMEGLSDDE